MTLEVKPRDIDKGFPPVAEKVVMVDFDGTLYPWGGMFTYPEPIKGAPAAVRLLKRLGYRIGIFTSRLSKTWHESEGWDHHEATVQHIQYITEICKRDNIPFDFITAEKVPAEAYFDDRAFRVTGNAPLPDIVFVFSLLNHPNAEEREAAGMDTFIMEAFGDGE